MSRAPVLCLLGFLVACGDDGGGGTTVDAGRRDSAISIDAPPSDCDYAEMSDLTNDTSDTGVTETTGLTFATSNSVCGTFNKGHWDGSLVVDADSYTLTLAADADVIVRLIAPGAELLKDVTVDIYNTDPVKPVSIATFYGNHGVLSAHLTAGTFELLAYVLDDVADIANDVPYRIEVTIDNPETRCPEATSGGFAETLDASGNMNAANDVIAVPSGAPIALTASATDMAEATNIVMAPDFSNRVTGTAANITGPDQYEDKDTYLFSTGTGTNELTIRLDWPTAGANLDWFLLEQNSVSSVARAIKTATTGPETRLLAVKPSTSYWLFVGAKAATTVPATYTATLCGAKYTP